MFKMKKAQNRKTLSFYKMGGESGILIKYKNAGLITCINYFSKSCDPNIAEIILNIQTMLDT